MLAKNFVEDQSKTSSLMVLNIDQPEGTWGDLCLKKSIMIKWRTGQYLEILTGRHLEMSKSN